MSDYDLGWRGKNVKHEDGRTGKIKGDFVGFGFVTLDIRVDEGGEAHVQLNTNSKDSGEEGWSWLCEKYNDGPAWLKLGDHW